MSTPLFTTNHAPLGAWASLTFGAAGQGLRIEDQQFAAKANADLLLAITRDGVTSAFPFIENPTEYSGWRLLSAGRISARSRPASMNNPRRKRLYLCEFLRRMRPYRTRKDREICNIPPFRGC